VPLPGTRVARAVARARAAFMGFAIASEFLGFRDSPINTPELAAETVDRIDGIGLVLDSCHWHASGSPSLQGYPIGRLVLVHLNDAPAKSAQEIEDADRLLPGEGVIKLAELTQDLKTGGYAGPWSLETFNPSYWAEAPRAVAGGGCVAVSPNVSADQRSSREHRKHTRD